LPVPTLSALTEVIITGASAVSLTEPMPVLSHVLTAAICPIAGSPINAVASSMPMHLLSPASLRALDADRVLVMVFAITVFKAFGRFRTVVCKKRIAPVAHRDTNGTDAWTKLKKRITPASK
jgi:hypothetical protein